MTEPSGRPAHPQIYLVTPPVIEPDGFSEGLARVLEACPVAAIRLDLATRDEARLTRAADAVREIAHARDIPVVITEHLNLVGPLGLDGVHLAGGARGVRAARKALGREAIVGAFCGASRHEGLVAGDAGADYVAFGPVGETALGRGERAPREIFAWWSEMIELPVVAEGALTPGLAAELAPVVDFLALGEEIWSAPDPAAQLAAFVAACERASRIPDSSNHDQEPAP